MADAGRVIAGTARSIRLDAPGPGTRPLADRVKEALFAILEPDIEGAAFLDLFAGSGAAGLEYSKEGSRWAHVGTAGPTLASCGPPTTLARTSSRRW